MAMKKMPWPLESYKALEPGDLDPKPPTPEQRIRVAAALLTYMRDASMLGKAPSMNAETIRGILVMDDAAWARDIGTVAEFLRDGYEPRQTVVRYDAEDPFVRFQQTNAAMMLRGRD